MAYRDLADFINLGEDTYEGSTYVPPSTPTRPAGPLVIVDPRVPLSQVPEASRPLIALYDVAEVLNAPCPWSAATKARYDELVKSPYVTARSKEQLRAWANQCQGQSKPVATPVPSKPSAQTPTLTWKPPTIPTFEPFTYVKKPVPKPVPKPLVKPQAPTPMKESVPSLKAEIVDIEEWEKQQVERQEKQKEDLESLRAQKKQAEEAYRKKLPSPLPSGARPLDIPSTTYVPEIPSALEVSQYQRPSPSTRAVITVPRSLEEPTSRIPTFQQKVERTGGDSFITSIQKIFSPVGQIQFFSGFDLINFYFEKGQESARPTKTVVVPKAAENVKIGGWGVKDATIKEAEKLLIPVYEEVKENAKQNLGLPENIETFSLGPPAIKKLTPEQKKNLSKIKEMAKNVRNATLALPKKEDVNSKYLQDSVIGDGMRKLKQQTDLCNGLRKLFQEYELEVLILISFLEMREKWNVGMITTLCDNVQTTDDIAAYNAAIKFITGIQNMMSDVITIPRNIITKLVDKKTSWFAGVSTLPFLTERKYKYRTEVKDLEKAIQQSARSGDEPPEQLKQRLKLATDLWKYFFGLVQIHEQKTQAVTGW
jgi:hypothetical protein